VVYFLYLKVETPKQEPAINGQEPGGPHMMMILAGLFLLNLLLRIFYLRFDFVNGDEAVRALTAARVLDGARLYVDIVTDKPPGATWFYAGVFALFGRSMSAVHIAAVLWNFATAMIIYRAAASFYNRRTGVWAALAFIYFSTNYLTPDTMAANTELLMVLPYTAAFYLFIKARTTPRDGLRSFALLVAAGFMTGIAALFKQVAVFNLAFFALYEVFDAINSRARLKRDSKDEPLGFRWILPAAKRAISSLLRVAAGFAIVAGLFVAWLASTGALEGFWRYTVVLGKLYVDALPASLWWRFLTGRVSSYVAFNAALWGLAAWVTWRAAARLKKRGRNLEGEEARPAIFDLAIALWAVMSLSGVFAGGRFFGHYFIQALPALSLLGGRGFEMLGQALSDAARRRRAQIAAAAIAFLILFGLVRFHQRTAILAYETLTGARTAWSEGWGMTEREREAETVAQILRGHIKPGDPLFVWDYGLDIYWRTGARPASRYLTPYYITGVWPEISTGFAPDGEPFWREERAALVEDLNRARPRLIVDVSGSLLRLPYAEVVDFVEENYRYDESIGTDPARPFMVYSLRE
jgi:4-amino-4-deoxy-L-arabinose transferase-like glycosyltransferase